MRSAIASSVVAWALPANRASTAAEAARIFFAIVTYPSSSWLSVCAQVQCPDNPPSILLNRHAAKPQANAATRRHTQAIRAAPHRMTVRWRRSRRTCIIAAIADTGKTSPHVTSEELHAGKSSQHDQTDQADAYAHHVAGRRRHSADLTARRPVCGSALLPFVPCQHRGRYPDDYPGPGGCPASPAVPLSGHRPPVHQSLGNPPTAGSLCPG